MSDADVTGRRLPQNVGVLGEAEPGDKQIINGETTPPGAFGYTEGGMPEGTPPVAPVIHALDGDETWIEDTEDDLGVPEPAFSDTPPRSE